MASLQHLTKSYQRALDSELSPKNGSFKTLCYKNKLSLSQTVLCHGDVRHHLAGCCCLSVATAPTSLSLVTLTSSLAPALPISSTPPTPPSLIHSFPVNSWDLSKASPTASVSWITDSLSAQTSFNPAKSVGSISQNHQFWHLNSVLNSPTNQPSRSQSWTHIWNSWKLLIINVYVLNPGILT